MAGFMAGFMGGGGTSLKTSSEADAKATTPGTQMAPWYEGDVILATGNGQATAGPHVYPTTLAPAQPVPQYPSLPDAMLNPYLTQPMVSAQGSLAGSSALILAVGLALLGALLWKRK